MSAKHRDPVFLVNRRIVRAQVQRAWRHGDDARCWRCHGLIAPGTAFDVGHLDPDGGHGVENLAPEHVRCNRREGGRRGAAITAANRGHRTPRPVRGTASRAGLAPWFEAARRVFFAVVSTPAKGSNSHPSPRTIGCVA